MFRKNIKKKANSLDYEGISFLSSNYVPKLHFLIYVLDLINGINIRVNDYR